MLERFCQSLLVMSSSKATRKRTSLLMMNSFQSFRCLIAISESKSTNSRDSLPGTCCIIAMRPPSDRWRELCLLSVLFRSLPPWSVGLGLVTLTVIVSLCAEYRALKTRTQHGADVTKRNQRNPVHTNGFIVLHLLFCA